MEYVKVKMCRMRGCKRPVWENGEEYCDRCREKMDALGIEDEPKDLTYWLMIGAVALILFLGVGFVLGYMQ